MSVFRDETSLSASPELWSAVEEALSRARYFVLLASPDAAASHWVDQEVRWWREHRGNDTVLIALTHGELRWDERSGDFDSAAPIPPGLRGWFPREPLWVDLRWARGERDVSLRNPRFRDSVGELAAALHGIPKDELIGEDISQHRRTLRLARGAVALLVVLLTLAVIGGIVALIQRNNARNQTELALAGQVSATSVANLEDRLDVAQLLAAEGYSRRPTSQTTAALFRAATESPQLAKFVDNGTPVSALVPATDDQGVIVGDTSGTVRAWSFAHDQVGPPLVDLRRPVSALQASDGGRYLAAGDEAGSVAVVDLNDRDVSRGSVPGGVDALAVTDDGRWLAAASNNFRLTLFDLRAGAVQRTVSVDNPVMALAFRDADRTLFVGGSNGSFQRRDLPSLAPLAEPTNPKTPAAYDVSAYSANQRYFGFYKFGVLVWTTDPGRNLPGPPDPLLGADRSFPITSTGEATALAIPTDASRVAVATEGAIRIVEPQVRPSIFADFEPGIPVTGPLSGISGQTGLLAFDGTGERLVSASDSLLALWDLNQDARIARPLPVSLPDTATASTPPGLAIARGGGLVAWSRENDQINVWERGTGRRTLPNPGGLVSYGPVALSSDGGLIAAGGGTGIQIWDLTGSNGPLKVPSSGTLSEHVSVLEPDTSSDSMFAIWDDGHIDRLSLDAAQLRPLVAASGGTYLGEVAIAPEADLAVEVIDGGLSQIDLTTGQRSAGPTLGLTTVSAVALSHDGHLLAAADGEENAVLWDMRRGQPLRRMSVGRLASLAFNPDARLLVTLTGEGVLSVWDVGSGTKLGEVQLRESGEALTGDRGYETALRFSPDGDLWTATTGGGLIRWPMSPEAWERSICETVNRSLSQDEWERYIGTDGSPEFSCPTG